MANLTKEQVDMITHGTGDPDNVDGLLQALTDCGFNVQEQWLYESDLIPGQSVMAYSVFLGKHQFSYTASIHDTRRIMQGTEEDQREAENHIVYDILCSLRNYTYVPDSYEEFLEDFGWENHKTNWRIWKESLRMHGILVDTIPEHLWEALPQ